MLLARFLGLWGGGSGGESASPAGLAQNQEAELLPHQQKQQHGPSEQRASIPGMKLPCDHRSTTELDAAIESSSKRLIGLMMEKGVPGLTVCVAKRGAVLWQSAFGFCDVENMLECKPEARMRIASISKALFVSTVVAPMIERGELDIKSSVHDYLSPDEFPRKQFDGKPASITIEQLLSHTSGIRHYQETRSDETNPLRPIGSPGSKRVYQCEDQYSRNGFFSRKTYRGVLEALDAFKTDPLVSEPGKFSYTTYGYTLLSAAVERARQRVAVDKKAKGEQIEDFWVKTLGRDWSLNETSLDQDEPILSNRARFYLRTARNGGLINAPYTDGSVKWAGGGIVSTTRDLVKFGNALIDSYKGKNSPKLKRETLDLLWKEVQGSYGLGFQLKSLDPIESGGEKVAAYHLGNALGASSALILYPESEVVVAILTNMGEVSLGEVSLHIASQFAKASVQ